MGHRKSPKKKIPRRKDRIRFLRKGKFNQRSIPKSRRDNPDRS